MNTSDPGSRTVSTAANSEVSVVMPSTSHAAPRYLHADAHLLVLEKPAGLLCVPGRGPDKQDCLAARVQHDHADARVVHRLDMATSGLWVMARGSDAQRRLSHAFASRAVRKRYVACVAGRPDAQDVPDADGWHRIDLPLIIDWPNRPRSIVDMQRGKPSLTRWRLLASDGATSRVELEPHTGRSHQLRVHLQAIGHPILGDTLYGSADVAAASPRLLLHACELTLPHPAEARTMRFESLADF